MALRVRSFEDYLYKNFRAVFIDPLSKDAVDLSLLDVLVKSDSGSEGSLFRYPPLLIRCGSMESFGTYSSEEDQQSLHKGLDQFYKFTHENLGATPFKGLDHFLKCTRETQLDPIGHDGNLFKWTLAGDVNLTTSRPGSLGFGFVSFLNFPSSSMKKLKIRIEGMQTASVNKSKIVDIVRGKRWKPTKKYIVNEIWRARTEKIKKCWVVHQILFASKLSFTIEASTLSGARITRHIVPDSPWGRGETSRSLGQDNNITWRVSSKNSKHPGKFIFGYRALCFTVNEAGDYVDMMHDLGPDRPIVLEEASTSSHEERSQVHAQPLQFREEKISQIHTERLQAREERSQIRELFWKSPPIDVDSDEEGPGDEEETSDLEEGTYLDLHPLRLLEEDAQWAQTAQVHCTSLINCVDDDFEQCQWLIESLNQRNLGLQRPMVVQRPMVEHDSLMDKILALVVKGAKVEHHSFTDAILASEVEGSKLEHDSIMDEILASEVEGSKLEHDSIMDEVLCSGMEGSRLEHDSIMDEILALDVNLDVNFTKLEHDTLMDVILAREVEGSKLKHDSIMDENLALEVEGSKEVSLAMHDLPEDISQGSEMLDTEIAKAMVEGNQIGSTVTEENQTYGQHSSFTQDNLSSDDVCENEDLLFIGALHKELKDIDNISEVSSNHEDLQSLLHGVGTIIFCCYDAKDSQFEFYFKNCEDMASVVGVGLQYAKVILIEVWKVKVHEIPKVEWEQTLSRVRSSSTVVFKSLKLELPRTLHHVEKEAGVEVDKEFTGRPRLWDLAKYFIMKEIITSFANNNGASSSDQHSSREKNSEGSGGDNQGFSSIFQGLQKLFFNPKNNMQDNDGDGGENRDNSGEPHDSDGTLHEVQDTTVSIQLLEGGEIVSATISDKDGERDMQAQQFREETRKDLEILDRTILPSLELTFSNRDGIKKIRTKIGKICFRLDKAQRWLHYDMEAYFGLHGINQYFGEVIRSSYVQLDLDPRSGIENMKVTRVLANTQGNATGTTWEAAGKPLGFGASMEAKTTTLEDNTDSRQFESGEDRNCDYTRGGLRPREFEDTHEIGCQYFGLDHRHYIDLSPLSSFRRSQTVEFEGMWYPIECPNNVEHGPNLPASDFVEYELEASRSLELLNPGQSTLMSGIIRRDESSEFFKYRQKYGKKILLNHGMTHLDGEPRDLRELEKPGSSDETFLAGKGRVEYIWRTKLGSVMEPLVKVPSSVHDSSSSIHDPSSSVHDPSCSFHDPSSSVHDPSSSVHDPSNSVHDPSNSVHDPSCSFHDPSSSVHDPSNSVHDPSCSFHDPSSSVHIRSSSTPDPLCLDLSSSDPSSSNPSRLAPDPSRA